MLNFVRATAPTVHPIPQNWRINRGPAHFRPGEYYTRVIRHSGPHARWPLRANGTMRLAAAAAAAGA
jgi:hypothetical protein